MRVSVRCCGLLWVVAAVFSSSVPAQTLARPGWQGSGLTLEHWWDSAVLYQADPLTFQDAKENGFGGLRGIVERLDYFQSLGVDALVLSPLPFEASGSSRASDAPFDRAYGSGEDLDMLVQEASRRRMRILVDLSFNSTLSADETANAARFWLSRGVAGLRLTNPDPQGVPLTAAQTASRLDQLERLCSSYPGQRILFWDLPEDTAPASSAVARVSHSRKSASRKRRVTPADAEASASSVTTGPQLVLDDRLLRLNRWQAGQVAPLLTRGPHAPDPLARSVVESDASGRPSSLDRFTDGAHRVEIARQIAALLLLGQAVPELYAGQELGMQAAATGTVAPEEGDVDSLLNWYRRLSSLRHANLALRSGAQSLLATPESDLVAWIRTPPAGAVGAAPVVVVCNLSAHAVMVSLSAGLRAQGIPAGTGLLRTLATSSPGTDVSATVPLSGLTLPAYGVYVGELRLQPGLESAPAPVRHRSGHVSAKSATRPE